MTSSLAVLPSELRSHVEQFLSPQSVVALHVTCKALARKLSPDQLDAKLWNGLANRKRTLISTHPAISYEIVKNTCLRETREKLDFAFQSGRYEMEIVSKRRNIQLLEIDFLVFRKRRLFRILAIVLVAFVVFGLKFLYDSGYDAFRGKACSQLSAPERLRLLDFCP